jgi:hypothetical protein
MKKFIFCIALLLIVAIGAFAQSTNNCISPTNLTLPLHTGVDNTGAILPFGSLEQHWTAVGGAPVTVDNRANFAASQWVTNGVTNTSSESYALAFCVAPCAGIDSLHLSFRMIADNAGCVYLDGIALLLTWFNTTLPAITNCTDGFGTVEPMLPGRGYVCNVTVPIAAGTHTLRVDITNVANSVQGIDVAGTITGVVNLASALTASISGATMVATGSTTPLCAMPVGNCFAYNWSNGTTTACANVGAGCYTVTVTNACNGCTATATQCVIDTATQHAPCTMHNSIVAKYKFSGNALDSKGTNHGTVTNAMLTDDRFHTPNSAYHFDGTAEIDMGNGTDFQMGSNSFSISVWAKPVAVYPSNGTNSFTIVGKRGILAPNSGCDPNYGIGFNGATHEAGTGYRPDPPLCSTLQVLPSPVASDSSCWHHYVAVYDRMGNNLRFYQDNILVNSVSSFAGGETFNVPFGNFKVGSNDVWNGTSMFDEHFIGDIDDIAVFRCALNATQVDTLFHLDKSFHFNVSASYRCITVATKTTTTTTPNFTVYPNPTNGAAHIDYTDIGAAVYEITLANSIGQTLQTLAPSNTKQTDIDLSGYPTGVYFITLQTDSGAKAVRKIVRE